MTVSHYLAFDLGAESGRAVLGTLENGRLTLTEKHRFPNPVSRMAGTLYWDFPQQWEHLKRGLSLTSGAAAGENRITLSGIGVDTWGVDFVLIGRDGSVLSNPVHYRDGRTDGILERVFAKVSRDEIFRQTGLQFMALNTLFQLAAMREKQSPLLDIADRLLFMPDAFTYLFTGKKVNEFSIVSTSQMYDPRQRDWAGDLLKKLNIPSALLGEVIPAGTVVGNVSADVAAEVGCEPVPVIATTGHDTASAVAAVPVANDSWCYISSGTWSLMGVELDEPIINDKSASYNYTNEGGVDGTIRFLKNIMGLWLVQECRRHWLREGQEHGYAELTQLAANAPAGGALIDPDHAPFGTPGEMPIKIAQFCQKTGQTAPAHKGQYVRACLESLALTYRRTLEGLEDILGRRLDVIHIVGGGSQNELLNQMTADACGRTVVAGPIEGTAIGNILVQALATGDVKSLAEARTIVRNSFPVKTYEPRNAAEWDKAYERFKKLVG